MKKLDSLFSQHELIPINLESGNFYPPHLAPMDDMVDALSGSKGAQRFEKAVSGMYLGEVLKATFPLDEFELNDIRVSVDKIDNANLIGTAIATLS